MIKFCPNCGYDLTKVMVDESVSSIDLENSRSGGLHDVSASKNEPKTSVLDDYSLPEDKNKVKVAVPILSDYRERFKRRELTVADVSVAPKILRKLPRQDSEMDQFGDLVIGNGIEQEF